VILKVHDLKKNLLNKVMAQGCVEIGNWRKCRIYLSSFSKRRSRYKKLENEYQLLVNMMYEYLN
jgi:hypothetical protein